MRQRACVPGLAGALAAVLFAGSVAAQTGAYVGFGGGQADSRQYDDRDGSYKVFGGWRFSPNVAIEATYVDLGDFGSGTPGPGPAYSARPYDHWGVAAQLVGFLPLGASGISLFGKAGLFYWYGYEPPAGGFPYAYTVTDEKTGTDLVLGAGAQFDFDRRWSVRAEWERYYDVAGGDISLASASLLYRF